MKKQLISLLLFALPGALILFAAQAQAQTIMPRDPVIADAIENVSTKELQRTVNDLVSFHNRNNLSTASADRTKGIDAAANYLYNRISEFIPASGDRLSVEKVYYKVGGEGQRIPHEIELCNIVATISGSNPTAPNTPNAASAPTEQTAHSRTIAVLAHYDNRGADPLDVTSYVPGANDNGSGVACMIELSRFLSKMPLHATVKLIFLSGEEHGLYGATYMASLARREGWELVAVLNNDMIGNSNASDTDTHDNTTLRVFSENIPANETDRQKTERIYNSSENDSPSRQLARYIKETGERYIDNMKVKLIYRNDRFGRGGDHSPFSAAGFPAVRLCEVNENYYRTHQNVETRDGIDYGDKIQGIDFEYLRKNTGVNLASVANLALAPAEPESVHIDASGLENTTLITWEAPSQGARPAGYYVLIRETDQSQWQKKIWVNTLQTRLPYSKDNYFFAVQSVSAGGHESIPVFATARRK